MAVPEMPAALARAIESGRVPSPPQVLLRLMQLVDGEQTTMRELADLVARDAGLATRVLTAANSPALRRRRELDSLDACLMALGTRMVRSIATCLSLRSLFERDSIASPGELAAFWGHSLAVAELARALAAEAGYGRPEEAYLAGLLHDVGELLLLSALGAPYAAALGDPAGEATLPAREAAAFGVGHPEAGAWLVDRWQLDAAVADAILFHHAAPAEIATAGALPQFVWLAHAALADAVPAPGLDGHAQRLGIATALAELRTAATARAAQVGAALGIPLPESLYALQVWTGTAPAAPPAADDASSEIALRLGGMALLQPLQQDILALDGEAEMLHSLREAARILFDLGRVAFLRCRAPDGRLSGQGIDGQPAVFGQFDGVADPAATLAGAAALAGDIRHACGSLPSLADRQFARALGSPGLLCVPMPVVDRLAGVMVCGVDEAQYRDLGGRLAWLQHFGRLAGRALAAQQAARERLAEAELEAAGRFVRQGRRIIHEAGNPLGIIRSYLRLLERKLPEGAEVQRELGVLGEEIERVAGIVGRLSEIPRPAEESGVDVGELIRELLAVYGEALFGTCGIRLETALPAGPLPVACARDGVKQILVNLWKNASEALAAGQRLRIAASGGVLHNGRPHVQIDLVDDGPGMPLQAMQSLQRPAELAGEGRRGMGLSIVGEIAGRLGIAITCRSQAGQGTSLSLLLPATEAGPPPADTA